MEQVPEQVRAFLVAAGRKGGQAKSARKQATSRANGKRSQPSAPAPVEITATAPPVVMMGRPPACVIVRPKPEQN